MIPIFDNRIIDLLYGSLRLFCCNNFLQKYIVENNFKELFDVDVFHG